MVDIILNTDKHTEYIIELAKTNPEVLIDLVNGMPYNYLKYECISVSENGVKKIKAIKYLREKTGLGLKEAKDQIDKWFDEYDFDIPF